MKDLPDAEPLPHISVVELLSEDEEEVQLPHFPPNVVNWIKTAIPQPVMLPAGYVEAQTKAQQIQSKISSLEKVLSPPPDSLKSEEDSQTSNVVGWFVTGLGLKMPQPVTRSKDDVEVHSVSPQPKHADLVLEEVVEGDLKDLNQEVPSKDTHSETHPQTTQPAKTAQAQTTQPKLPVKPDEQELNLPNVPESTTASLEDAETQTGRWTPFVESIKREAEGIAIATMEERMNQERLDLVRMAEEVARHTAEMTIRQMQEAQSIKLSINSQEAILEEEDPESFLKRQVCPVQEKPVEVSELALQPEPREPLSPVIERDPEEEPEPVRSSSPDPSLEPEPDNKEEPQTKPESQDTKVAPEPVTQQPQKQEGEEDSHQPDTTTKEEAEPADEGSCGVPGSCDAIKRCLMRIPHVPACLDSFNNLLKEYNITPPKLPSVPHLPTSLSRFTSQVTKLVPSLPPELSQEFSQYTRPFTQMSQRVSQLPQQISQLPQRMSQLPRQLQVQIPQVFPGLPTKLPSLPQTLANIPSQIYNLPQRAGQTYTNVPLNHQTRTPSPSSPGSTLELPNVPSYPRLPPISLSRQLSGLSNPALQIEDVTSSARPSASSKLSVHPAVNVEDVDSGGREHSRHTPQILTPQDPNLKTLTVPGVSKTNRQSAEKE
ncbi:hypothetical protein UPYG_G00268230 [Umbra pygmaea]|uniref:Uncharacterized protein n=1 Tax=Umbra pygmaea TaxID=75934 RepID=A0ABD0WB78_UMBPY